MTINNITRAAMSRAISETSERSAWERGVKFYARELLDGLDDGQQLTEAALLNGARDWSEYSEGGCSLVYDGDICERLCPPSTIARKRGGDLAPSSRETWLDVQARALRAAARLVMRAARTLANGGEV